MSSRFAVFLRRAGLVVAGIVTVALAARAVIAFRSFTRGSGSGAMRISPTAPAESRAGDTANKASLPPVVIADSLRGRSGVVRFATLTPAEAEAVPGFVARFSEAAMRSPGVYSVVQGSDTFSLITLRAFADKRAGYVGSYRLGDWPAERWLMARNYFNPDGFVEITSQTASLPLSPHFVLGDFVTHDQLDRWPKYVVLEPKLIDKLELVLQDIADHGHATTHVVVLSGFRAPYYNDRGVNEGMARASRHQYGDAADIVLDSDGDGKMDDLNHDGRSDLRDIRPITDAITRVEQRHHDLVGGLGTYSAMGPRGPFAHVDVRGTSARWERVMRR